VGAHQGERHFQRPTAEEAAVWSATTKDNLRHRIATKAAVAVEELMLDAIDMVQGQADRRRSAHQGAAVPRQAGSAGEQRQHQRRRLGPRHHQHPAWREETFL
jgi:hypothetical protein